MKDPACINLLERVGGTYRIAFDPVFDPKHRRRESLDPWMMLIPCQRGVIYPFGGSQLAVEVDGRPVTARRLLESGVCSLYQDGDERTFTFHVADFETVAAIVKPRKRRQISEAERARLAAIGFQSPLSDQPQRAPTDARDLRRPKCRSDSPNDSSELPNDLSVSDAR